MYNDIDSFSFQVVEDESERSSFADDICLMSLKKKLDLESPAIDAMALTEQTPPDGTECFLAGWGVTVVLRGHIAYAYSSLLHMLFRIIPARLLPTI